MDCTLGGEAGPDIGQLVLEGREVGFDAVPFPEVCLVGGGAVGAAANDVAQGLNLPYKV